MLAIDKLNEKVEVCGIMFPRLREWFSCTTQNSYECDESEDDMYLLDLGFQKACFATNMPADMIGPEGVGNESCL
jgi:hypothetical protein